MRRALLLLAAVGVVRLLVGAVVPLFEDEAYYWVWALNPSTGYFDHPPAIAWLVGAGLPLLGDSYLGVRLFSIVGGVVTTWALAFTAWRIAGTPGAGEKGPDEAAANRSAWRASLLILALPLGAAGLLLATPDAALLLTLALTMAALDRALDSDPGSRRDTGWWLITGVALGTAFTAKYTAVLFPFGVTVAFLAHPELRRRFLTLGPWLASAVALLVFSPVVLWNAENDWASFAFQLGHGLGGGGSRPFAQVMEMLGGQVGLASPILFFMMAWATWRALRQRREPRRFVLAVTATVIFGFFVFTATRDRVEANWPALAYVPAIVLLATQPLTSRGRRWYGWGLGVGFAFVLLMNVQALYPVIPIPARNDPLAEAYGWDALAAAVDRETDQMLSDSPGPACTGRVWAAANNYQDPSLLTFHRSGRERHFDLQLARRPSQYRFWEGFTDLASSGDCLVVVFRTGSELEPVAEHLGAGFARWEMGPLEVLRRNGTGEVWEDRQIVRYYGWTGALEPFTLAPD